MPLNKFISGHIKSILYTGSQKVQDQIWSNPNIPNYFAGEIDNEGALVSNAEISALINGITNSGHDRLFREILKFKTVKDYLENHIPVNYLIRCMVTFYQEKETYRLLLDTLGLNKLKELQEPIKCLLNPDEHSKRYLRLNSYSVSFEAMQEEIMERCAVFESGKENGAVLMSIEDETMSASFREVTRLHDEEIGKLSESDVITPSDNSLEQEPSLFFIPITEAFWQAESTPEKTDQALETAVEVDEFHPSAHEKSRMDVPAEEALLHQTEEANPIISPRDNKSDQESIPAFIPLSEVYGQAENTPEKTDQALETAVEVDEFHPSAHEKSRMDVPAEEALLHQAEEANPLTSPGDKTSDQGSIYNAHDLESEIDTPVASNNLSSNLLNFKTNKGKAIELKIWASDENIARYYAGELKKEDGTLVSKGEIATLVIGTINNGNNKLLEKIINFRTVRTFLEKDIKLNHLVRFMITFYKRENIFNDLLNIISHNQLKEALIEIERIQRTPDPSSITCYRLTGPRRKALNDMTPEIKEKISQLDAEKDPSSRKRKREYVEREIDTKRQKLISFQEFVKELIEFRTLTTSGSCTIWKYRQLFLKSELIKRFYRSMPIEVLDKNIIKKVTISDKELFDTFITVIKMKYSAAASIFLQNEKIKSMLDNNEKMGRRGLLKVELLAHATRYFQGGDFINEYLQCINDPKLIKTMLSYYQMPFVGTNPRIATTISALPRLLARLTERYNDLKEKFGEATEIYDISGLPVEFPLYGEHINLYGLAIEECGPLINEDREESEVNLPISEAATFPIEKSSADEINSRNTLWIEKSIPDPLAVCEKGPIDQTEPSFYGAETGHPENPSTIEVLSDSSSPLLHQGFFSGHLAPKFKRIAHSTEKLIEKADSIVSVEPDVQSESMAADLESCKIL